MKRSLFIGLASVVLPAFWFYQDVSGQITDYVFSVPQSASPTAPYAAQLHRGVRSVTGPFDLDGDLKKEVLLTDYSGGGRVHVVENTGVDSWELVYSTPWISSNSAPITRYAYGADLDGDNKGEILFLSGATAPPGLVVFEHTGADNEYGSVAASIFALDSPDRFRVEQFAVDDVDGDGTAEVLMPNNASDNAFDKWYIFSVSGDIGSGSEIWSIEAEVTSRAIGTDLVDRGGGSPYAILPANLDGDATLDLAMHSWNNYNFTNGAVTGVNTYQFPPSGTPNLFLHASATDDVSHFANTVADINGDGDDEVFFMRWQGSAPGMTTGNVSVLNYELGEDALRVAPGNFVIDVIQDVSYFGVAAGDITFDLQPEILGTGEPYEADSFMDGRPANYLHYATFTGVNPELSSNYAVFKVDLSNPFDSTLYDAVHSDSLGETTSSYRNSALGPPFAVKLAYLGDADLDGDVEVALAFQGIADTVIVTNRVWNLGTGMWDETITRQAVELRPFMRIVSFEMDVPDPLLLIAGLAQDIGQLAEDGLLNSGQATALLAKLTAATHQLDRNEVPAAVNQLRAFVNNVEAFVNGRVLSAANGQPLIDVAQQITDQLTMGKLKELRPANERVSPTALPESFNLAGNYPNPFNPTTTLTIDLPEESEVRLTVYDVLGREIERLVDGAMPAGSHRVTFGAGSLPSGLYLARLETDGGTFTRRMMLVK